MKRATAIRYCQDINRRLLEVNGTIVTCRGEFEYVAVTKVWVFGSTAKGSESPNDLDLLIQMREGGQLQGVESAGFDPLIFSARGLKFPRSSRSEALMWLTKGMRNVSRHIHGEEMIEIDLKAEIYPTLEVLS